MSLMSPPVAVSVLLLTGSSIVLAAAAAGSERRDLDAHAHGVTTLNVALDEDVLTLELEGPAMNFVGFEHPARTPDQKQAIAEALEILEGQAKLFRVDPDADCRRIEGTARHVTDGDEHGHHDDHGAGRGHDHHHDHDEEGDRHAEFVGRYRYRCGRPDRLTELRVDLFERFPLTHEVEASFLGPDVQTFRKLTAADPVLRVGP